MLDHVCITYYIAKLKSFCIQCKGLIMSDLARAVLGNIGPRSWQYGPSAARSVQKPTEGRYSPVRLEQATLVSSLLGPLEPCLF